VKKIVFGLLGLAALFSQPASAATLVTNPSGILLGATGVIVGNGEYNVSFRDSTCNGSFGGCNELSDFAFNSASDAMAAGNALLTQVLNGTFNTTPGKISGCTDTSTCTSYIPYGFDSANPNLVLIAGAQNRAVGNDSVHLTTISKTTNLNQRFGHNFAVFTYVGAAPVPEASTWAMMVLGLGAIGGALRRRRKGAPALA